MKKVFNIKKLFAILLLVFTLVVTAVVVTEYNKKSNSNSPSSNTTTTTAGYKVSQEEKDYLNKRFSELSKVNNETVAYIYAPGTELDEPVVQTNDNETYLNKTFEGGNVPYLGTVFMDMDNKKDFSDRLTWLFGHARGSKVGDHRMFNDVNFYDKQDYMNKHKYVVVETPERKYYYEAAFLTIVPETTSFYRLDFENDNDFLKQLTDVKKDAKTKNDNVVLKGNDKYLVLSTCREEDETIRSNLYLRLIPDEEMNDFLAEHKDELKYVATR
ncbi:MULTISPECIES: class B sortase, LPKTxAVK-specific [Gemella]|uniref:class B sortase, LPKTxAVK-specific n=1 Tax=Gemella TaxID=1378 RepID=UPI0007681F75|nr:MULTISPECIES: class B sortase, LPKTxAVK-specific [Gemella]AME09881.1 SrtB family sortase [Gemella sp. oral taxon 928]AXI26019.1 SrtB family sortase [Gemella sp. ND 6198]